VTDDQIIEKYAKELSDFFISNRIASESTKQAIQLAMSNCFKEIFSGVDDAVTSLENTLAGKKLDYEVQSYGVSVSFNAGAKPESFSETVKADLSGSNGREAHLDAVKKHYPERSPTENND
jgi:hypothetical protein